MARRSLLTLVEKDIIYRSIVLFLYEVDGLKTFPVFVTTL
jgi:hypothetical protein